MIKARCSKAVTIECSDCFWTRTSLIQVSFESPIPSGTRNRFQVFVKFSIAFFFCMSSTERGLTFHNKPIQEDEVMLVLQELLRPDLRTVYTKNYRIIRRPTHRPRVSTSSKALHFIKYLYGLHAHLRIKHRSSPPSPPSHIETLTHATRVIDHETTWFHCYLTIFIRSQGIIK